jgi:hypothetical protein
MKAGRTEKKRKISQKQEVIRDNHIKQRQTRKSFLTYQQDNHQKMASPANQNKHDNYTQTKRRENSHWEQSTKKIIIRNTLLYLPQLRFSYIVPTEASTLLEYLYNNTNPLSLNKLTTASTTEEANHFFSSLYLRRRITQKLSITCGRSSWFLLNTKNLQTPGR